MRYGLAKKLKQGIRLKIFPSFRCNLKCDYCGNGLQIGLDPQNTKQVLSNDEWFDLIHTFPIKVKEVALSGGEPTIWRGFSSLVNKLLDHNYFVMVLTNLTTTKSLMEVNKSNKLFILSTFHGRFFSKDKYIINYKEVNKKHRIVVKEIGENKLEFSRQAPFGCTVALGKQAVKNCLYIGPNGLIFPNCYDIMNYYKKI